jgi:hypothetical protein
MDSKLLKGLVVLGVPGVAIGAFYLLLRTFAFKFSEIGATWAAIIAIVFLIVVGVIVAFALHRFAPPAAKTQDDGQRRKTERAESRKEDWLQEALDHADAVLQRINAARSVAIQQGGLLDPEQVQIAILKALTPEYSPEKLGKVEGLGDITMREALANVSEAFRAVRIAQMDLANGAAPSCEEHDPAFAVQWYTTQLSNFRSAGRRLLAGHDEPPH